jgi:DinB superfamily
MTRYNFAVLNPYASFLGDRDPIEVIERTARVLSDLAMKLNPASLEWRPAPGKWNAREILCHLADCEIAFAFRLRQTLAQEHHVMQPFDQERWAGMYGGLGTRSALNVFSSLREWNLALIGSTPAEAMSRPVTHPERGEMTFRVIIETMAGHDLNHLKQVDAIAAGFTTA